MKEAKTIYLSLGSNLGNKFFNLQRAVLLLQKELGIILEISGVYKSPSWGFEGEDFLNACLSIETQKIAKEVLRVILKVERELGRKRVSGEGYQSRNIDIDLLYYGSEIIETDELIVPHPQMHLRRFVLRPLADIAPQFYHPVFDKDTRNLLQECKDKTNLKQTTHKLYASRELLFSQLHLVAIEGNIGAGKTTLARKIASDHNAKLVLERFADNPFLPKFYNDQSRYAFPLEMSFLADRYQQFTDDTTQFDLFKNFMVSDYDIYKSLIFAQITLQKEEFKLYRKMFNFMYNEVKKPDIYIFLYQRTERLLENIRKRGRDYEQGITKEYLEKINRGYFDFLKGFPHRKSLIINIDDLDFVENKADYELIIDKILEQALAD
ncbi:2-amino-4-hydroxy-6-hydroxymethyldihydropteridine diphosphokinase [uncultured Eudoraea sp.]|uniref:2-amino-4-hydroxy-6- hydroxymethyldihydropteridine diphosphokinase n=1 Tax=uncultured Eudoraea sp. TaxID=1035614 RepID=UPI002630D117|nr:2-amino-4-hydroxy-6-hydroxymethyldihydropteridine diphosphokinase [uncultured Eudoraea sp.]